MTHEVLDEHQTISGFAEDERRDPDKHRIHNHFSAFTQVALHVRHNEFVFQTRPGIIRGVKTKIAGGSDPRFLPQRNDLVLNGQIEGAGVALWRDILIPNESLQNTPIVQIIADPEQFSTVVPFEGWRQTFRHLATVLPDDTTPRDIAWLLISFSKIRKIKSVPERIGAARKIFNTEISEN